jgi:hypothetical protein
MAVYYAKILFRTKLENDGFAHFPLVLRILALDSDGWMLDESSPKDHYTKTTIPPERLEVMWQGQWRPMNWAAAHLGDLIYSYNDETGCYQDWEGEELGEEVLDAEYDVASVYKEWGLLPP